MFFILITVVPEPADEDEESGRDDEDEEQDDSEQDDSVQESKGGDDEEEEIIIEEDDESKGEQDEVPPKTTPVLKCFTNLIKSFLSNSKETATEPTTPESDDHRIEAINTLSILRAQVQKEVQAEVLKHHADAEGSGLLRVSNLDRLSVVMNITLVWLDGAINDFHQGGFASTVLAQNGVRFARTNCQRHRAIGHHTGVPLGDLRELESGRLLGVHGNL